MSDKALRNLDEIDRLLRRTFPPGPDQEPHPVTIRLESGFELWNTRPYHNYETFSDGWEVANHDRSIIGRAEDLDDAVRSFCGIVEVHRARARAKA